MVSFFFRMFLCDKDGKPARIRPWECVLAEGVNLLLWGVTLYLYGATAEAALVCLFLSALLLLSIVDWRTQNIPVVLNRFLLLLAIIRTVFFADQRLTYILGFFCISLVLAIGYWLTNGRGIGGGDVKLMAAAGLFLGWELSLWAFLTAGICACVVQGLRIKLCKAGSLFAFGPYLSAGILTMLWFADRLVS